MRLRHIGRGLPPREPLTDREDWVQANPARIERALAHALKKPGGGWFVVGASRWFAGEPQRETIAGRELVVWRGDAGLRVAPAECPHMGADLSCGRIDRGRLVCPWHGLSLGDEGHGSWKPLPVHDDGVLLWVRLPEIGEAATDRPLTSPRPARFMDGVVRTDARCEPQDVLANRLDPWHGVHYHPHSFAKLAVLEESVDQILLRVSYRVAGPLCVEVDATFHCPDPRTITMTIVGGDGEGSVVETHATPIEEGRTAIIEATLAASDRKGFRYARIVNRVVRPFIEARARRLWVEDAAYAERRYTLRTRSKRAAVPLRSVS